MAGGRAGRPAGRAGDRHRRARHRGPAPRQCLLHRARRRPGAGRRRRPADHRHPPGQDLRGLAAAAPSRADARIRSRRRARPGCADRPVAGRAGARRRGIRRGQAREHLGAGLAGGRRRDRRGRGGGHLLPHPSRRRRPRVGPGPAPGPGQRRPGGAGELGSEPFVVAPHYRFLAGLDRWSPPARFPTARRPVRLLRRRLARPPGQPGRRLPGRRPGLWSSTTTPPTPASATST